MTALIILDGFGIREESKYNAVKTDGVKNITKLWNEYPHTQIAASGLAVGLPEGQMGNSEVGHLNLGGQDSLPGAYAHNQVNTGRRLF